MTTSQRVTKQIIVATSFFFIVGGLGFWIFRTINPRLPLPTPNPTAHLIPINILSTQLLYIQDDDYDFTAKVSNANTDYGSADVEYELKFYNASNVAVSNRVGSFYILPGQTKFFIATPLKFSEPISRAELAIKSVD